MRHNKKGGDGRDERRWVEMGGDGWRWVEMGGDGWRWEGYEEHTRMRHVT